MVQLTGCRIPSRHILCLCNLKASHFQHTSDCQHLQCLVNKSIILEETPKLLSSLSKLSNMSVFRLVSQNDTCMCFFYILGRLIISSLFMSWTLIRILGLLSLLLRAGGKCLAVTLRPS